MKKILLTLFGLMLMFSGNVSAQEVTIDFSGSTDNWEIGTTKLIDAKEFTYGGYTIILEGTAGNGYRWYDSGNIILGKQGATLTLSAFGFDVERIDVVGTSSASASVKQNIFVGDEAVSTETTGAKDVTNQYVIAEGKQVAGTIYTLKVTSAHNTQITKILVWKKGTTVAEEIPVVENIASFNALEKGTKATLSCTEAQVIGAGNNNIIVKDASGSICMYNTGLTYTLGQILNGTITGTAGEFKGYKQLASMTENSLTATEGTITPTVVTAAEAAAAPLLSGPYKIENAVVKKDGNNFYIMDGEEKVLQLYNQFKDANITLAEGTFDIEGVVGNYNNVQFWVTSLSSVPTAISSVNAASIKPAIFNAAGQQLSAPQKGINIIGGKKVFVK